MKNLIMSMGNRIGFFLIAIGLVSLMLSCEKDIHPEVDIDPFDEVIVKISVADVITTSSAACAGIILPCGERTILSKGVCWSTASAPTLDDDVVSYSGKADSIPTELNGLMRNTNLLNLNDQ